MSEPKDREKDQKNEEYSFIREKIKETPKKKQSLLIRILCIAGSAVLFGLISAVIFAAVYPYMAEALHKDDTTITIPKDEYEEHLTEDDTESSKDQTDASAGDVSDDKQQNDVSDASEEDRTSVDKKKEENSDSSKDSEDDGDGKKENVDAGTENSEKPSVTPGTDAGTGKVEAVNKKNKLNIGDYENIYKELYKIAEEANRSVVTITGVTSNVDLFNNTYENEGQASGLIIANNGEELLILTEFKVVSGTETIRVTFQDETVSDAVLKKYDGNTGLSILSVPLYLLKQSTLNVIKEASLGNSFQTKQGDGIIALGSPIGYNYSVAYGMITSVKNYVSTIDANYNILTTDILGSSDGSGVLVNFKGEVVGIILQEYAGTKEQSTVTALGISEIKNVVEKLSNNMEIAYFGIKGRNVTSSIADEMGLPMGVYVTELAVDSPALIAGIQSADIIINFNGTDVKSFKNLQDELLKYEPDDIVSVTVMRQGMEDYQQLSFTVKLSILRQ